MRNALLVCALAMLASCMHAPATPRIDGAPGAPLSPATPWPAPAPVRTPPPPAAPPDSAAVAAASALRADSASAASVRQLQMPDVITLALTNNPTTRESWALARSAADSYGAARGALYPSLNATVTSASVSSSGSAGGATGGLDSTGSRNQPGGTNRNQLTASVSLSYLLVDLGGRSGTIEVARQQAIAANLVHNATIADVALQAESSLFTYVATRSLRDAQVLAVQESAADTAASAERLRVGVATLAELLQTRTQLAQQRFQLATLEGALVAAHGQLAVAMGLPANARFDVPEIDASDSVSAVAASVDTLVNRAITERPELAQLRAEAAALAANVRVARSAGYPALTLTSTGSGSHANIAGATGRNYSLVLGLQIPIFNGFARQYDLRAARESYQAGLARVESTRNQITVQVLTSYAALQTATQRVRTAGDLLATAQQSVDVALGRYREGVGTIIDLILTRSALITARAEDIQARWEWRTALAQLAHDVGVLDLSGRPNIPLGAGSEIR